MKSHFLLLPILFILGSLTLKSQSTTLPEKQSSIDLAVGFGKDLFSGAIGWNRTHGIAVSNKLRLGYGLRASLLSGKNLPYTTAPAKLAADNTKVDTLTVGSAKTMAINALINIQYMISSKISVGFNIDAIGAGFGGSTNGNFASSDNKNGSYAVNQNSKPTSLNVLLVGNNDIGQLKSELYAEVMATEKIGVKLALDLTFSEYTTLTKLTQSNDRFRYKANLVSVGIGYKF